MADDSMAKWRNLGEDLEKIEEIKAIWREVSSDNLVTREKFVALFEALQSDFSASDSQTLFDAVDKDKSGSVDFDELMWYIFDLDEAKRLGEAHKGGLHASTVFVRIRPIATDGGHSAGEDVEMKLTGFDESSIQIQNRHENLNFTFPKVVITPEVGQEEAFTTMMPPFMEAWTMKSYNILFLAYGQTGTGKTHTMLGTRESLSSDEPHPDWGLFPRIVNKCINQMEAGYKIVKGRWYLAASAMEFYMTQPFDLLNDHGPVVIDGDGWPVGLAQVRITKVSDLVPFIDTVNKTRTMSSTNMNAGSSRSHCALILTYYATDHKEGTLYSSTFTVVDMAGSERSTKTGADFIAPSMIPSIMASSKPLTKEQQKGAEGGLINFELTEFATAVQFATDCHTAKRPYRQSASMCPPVIKFLSRSLQGNALLGMIICLSQSPQNGWESWFSCTYGERLAKLKAPLKKMKPVMLEKELTKAEKTNDKAAKLFKDTPKSGHPSSKYYALRKGAARAAAEYLEIVKEMNQPVGELV